VECPWPATGALLLQYLQCTRHEVLHSGAAWARTEQSCVACLLLPALLLLLLLPLLLCCLHAAARRGLKT
jgi:hypothetical protein